MNPDPRSVLNIYNRIWIIIPQYWDSNPKTSFLYHFTGWNGNKNALYFKSFEEATWSCPFMNIDVISAETFLNSWCFPAMKSKPIAVLPVGTMIPANLCHPFAADHPTHLRRWVEGCHRPVPRPQVVSVEVDSHDRESCKWHTLFYKPSAGRREKLVMSILWFLLAIGIWIILQVYILPKLGISTWMKSSCQLGNEEDPTLGTRDNYRH